MQPIDATVAIKTCALCEASLPVCPVTDGEDSFCCPGCHVVYQLLTARGQLSGFAENPLFLQAVQSGLISNPGLLEEIRQQRARLVEGERCKLYVEIGEMWCPSCAEVIRLLLLKQRGVLNCVVDYATDLACVEFAPRYLSKDDIMALIKSFGYAAAPLETGGRKAVGAGLYLRFVVAAFCALNAMMFAYPLYATYFSYDGEGYGTLFAWLSLLSSLPVITYSAWPIWRRLAMSFKVGFFGMEILIAMGVWTAFGLSVYDMWHGGTHVYFDSMTVIIAFVLLGKIIEARAKFSAKESLFRLSRSVPRKGRKRFADGALRFVPAKEIGKGDIVEVYAGEKIPLDGKVVGGEGACDESLMTGEVVPVCKREADGVLGGAVLVQGCLVIEVTSASDDTALHKIIEMVERDIGHKGVYVRAVDGIVKWFVPAVVAFALFAGAVSWAIGAQDAPYGSTETAILRAIAVLLISCPCAIGIAAPLAESHLLSGLASFGAIVRNRGCLAHLGQETAFVFDKTGTATEGVYRVVSGLEALDAAQLAILQGLAASSTHPAAYAIACAVPQVAARFDKLEEVAGFGMRGTVAGQAYFLGSLRFMRQLGVDGLEDTGGDEAGGLVTSVYFADEHRCLAHLRLGDRIRDGVAELVQALKPARAILLSGDNEGPVAAVARMCGFDSWRAGSSPLEKREYIEALKRQGEVVCMLGDGINDAPALTAAHVGVSVVSATDISVQVSDLLLTTDRLEVVTKIRRLARLGRRIIRQNLFWAFFYNTVGIIMAALGLLSPIFAAFAMSASSLTVLLNARRVSGKGIAHALTSPE